MTAWNRKPENREGKKGGGDVTGAKKGRRAPTNERGKRECEATVLIMSAIGLHARTEANMHSESVTGIRRARIRHARARGHEEARASQRCEGTRWGATVHGEQARGQRVTQVGAAAAARAVAQSTRIRNARARGHKEKSESRPRRSTSHGRAATSGRHTLKDCTHMHNIPDPRGFRIRWEKWSLFCLFFGGGGGAGYDLRAGVGGLDWMRSTALASSDTESISVVSTGQRIAL